MIKLRSGDVALLAYSSKKYFQEELKVCVARTMDQINTFIVTLVSCQCALLFT